MVFGKSVLCRWTCIAALCVMLTSGSTAFGEVISYVNNGSSIYGGMAVLGDTALFNPTEFSSQAQGPRGADTVHGLFQLLIGRSDGIGSVLVEEDGTWSVVGHGNAAQAYVGTELASLLVTEVDGVTVSGASLTIPGTMEFTPSSGDVGSVTFNAKDTIDPANWHGTMRFDDVDSVLAGTAYEGGLVTHAVLLFDGVLITTSKKNMSALIDMQQVAVTTTTTPPTPISEPGTLALAAVAAMAGLTYSLRRYNTTPARVSTRRP
jgi:hypothetical protein